MTKLLSLFAISCLLSLPALGGSIKIRQVTTDGSSTSFTYSENWTPSVFTLTDGQIHFSGTITNGVPYLVAQSPQTGWAITDIVCVCYESNVATTPSNSCLSSIAADANDGEITITLQGDELVQCTVVDTPSPCSGAACNPTCGNGFIDPGEQCDYGIHNSASAVGPDECTDQCTRPLTIPRCVQRAIALSDSCNQLPGRTSEVSVMLMILAVLFWFARAARTRAF